MSSVHWEHKVFLAINTPFRMLGLVVLFVLTTIYLLIGALRLPLFLLLMAFNLVWLALVVFILAYAKISRETPFLRPISFVIALPLLMVGDFLVTIAPAPMPSDATAKLVKHEFLESFPYCSFEQLPAR